MTVFEYLAKLNEPHKYVRWGLMDWRLFRDRDIYSAYLIQKKDGRKTSAKHCVAIKFRVSLRTVERAIKSMERQL